MSNLRKCIIQFFTFTGENCPVGLNATINTGSIDHVDLPVSDYTTVMHPDALDYAASISAVYLKKTFCRSTNIARHPDYLTDYATL